MVGHEGIIDITEDSQEHRMLIANFYY